MARELTGTAGIQIDTGTPNVAKVAIIPASSAEAKAGTLDTKPMTPLKVKEVLPHIVAYAGDDIQTLLTEAATPGRRGAVVLTPGDHAITAALEMDDFTTLISWGAAGRATEYGVDPSGMASSLTHSAAAFTMLKNADPTNGNVAIEIRGIRFLMNGETGDNPIIDFNKVRRSAIHDCYLQGAATTSRIGIRHRGTSEHNLIADTSLEGCGIWSDGSSSRLVIRGCEIGAGGIKLVTGFAHMILDCDLYNDGVSGSFAQYPHIIYVQDVTGVLIRGNQLAGSLENGMYLTNMTRSIISDNEVKNSSRESSGAWSGIVLDSIGGTACANNTVRGNVCWDSAGGAGTQKTGITVIDVAVAGTADNLIVGNMLTGNKTAAAEQTVGLKNVWRDNLGTLTWTVASAGTITVPPGADFVTVSGTTGITSITAGYAGQRVTLMFQGALTVTDGSNLKLAGNFVSTADDTLTLVCDGTNWFQVSSSVN